MVLGGASRSGARTGEDYAKVVFCFRPSFLCAPKFFGKFYKTSSDRAFSRLIFGFWSYNSCGFCTLCRSTQRDDFVT